MSGALSMVMTTPESDVTAVAVFPAASLTDCWVPSADTVGLFHTDGSPAADEDGVPYTTDDLTSMVLIFALD